MLNRPLCPLILSFIHTFFSCRYGDKCKYLHTAQQQPRQNAFGFGTNSQQPKPNPFGFGVQNSGGSPFGAAGSSGLNQSNGFKPFENKWVRSEQPANQSQTTNHRCTDPASCKRLIIEDFQQESPLWKLTCYGHYKHFPCDIPGDISCEELRMAAYDEAKRGINMQSIIERERNLLKSKLMEFETLRQNPYTKQTQPNQTLFPAAGSSLTSQTPPNAGFQASGFNQQGSAANMAFGVKASVPSNTAFGQFQGSPGPFGTSNLPSGPFGSQVPAQTGGSLFAPNVAGFANSSSMSNQSSQVTPVSTVGNPFTSNVPGFGNGAMASQSSQVSSGGNPFASNLAGFGNSGVTGQSSQVSSGGNPFANVPGFGNIGIASQSSQLPSTSLVFPQVQTSVLNQSPMFPTGFGTTNKVEQVSPNTESMGKVQQEVSAADASIWLKEEWKLGEIPEQPPPDSVCRV